MVFSTEPLPAVASWRSIAPRAPRETCAPTPSTAVAAPARPAALRRSTRPPAASPPARNSVGSTSPADSSLSPYRITFPREPGGQSSRVGVCPSLPYASGHSPKGSVNMTGLLPTYPYRFEPWAPHCNCGRPRACFAPRGRTDHRSDITSRRLRRRSHGRSSERKCGFISSKSCTLMLAATVRA